MPANFPALATMGGWLSKRANTSASRLVFINEPPRADGRRTRDQYPSNTISNTKYTIWTFIPRNLYEQSKKFMNIYFLLVAFLQLFPAIAPVNPLTTWIPLTVIFGLSALKEGIDDYFRWKSDKRANELPIWVYRDGVKTKLQSQEIRVGDLIWIEEHEQFPCDVVILKTSDENGGCYIQTANLDGETDFKTRRAVPELLQMSEEEIATFQGLIECSAPNREIYKFDSRIKLSPSNKLWIPLDNSMTALQATSLKNTDWIIGAVVYTGNETKIGMNKTTPPTKWTRIDRFVNRATICLFAFQFLLVIALGVTGNIFRTNHTSKMWYLRDAEVVAVDYIIIPLRFLLLMSMMIPISLKVSMDIVKYVYSLLINWDLEMFDSVTNTPANANSTALSEDLGQIEYVFTDKTGTLTDNIMNFSKCSIKGRLYGTGRAYPNAVEDPKLLADIEANNDEVCTFVRALALCNSVVPAVEHGVFEYRGSSPDEEALVKAARELKFFFAERKLAEMYLETPSGTKEVYTVLATLEFSSDRKRMSVLLRENKTDKLLLFSKGADDKILPLIKPDQNGRYIQDHLETFARQGLRTLCIAYREVSAREYEEWKPVLDQASTALEGREDQLAEAYAMMERNFDFLGVTAIEDKLQEGVPESITKLRDAGIRVWMLTGDKYTTAVQIAASCNLTDVDGELITVSGQTSLEVGNSIAQGLAEMQQHRGSKSMSVIIQGSTLSIAFEDQAEALLELTLLAHTVICCRVTPHQKAQVVNMVKAQDKATLAIGDGGNDVSMIQEACVGVGIAGREGLQAARASDYSIAKFRFLVRLLLVHGRYSYRKTAFVATYCFHKSLFIAFIQIFFAFYSGFAGTSFFDSFNLMTYNTLFTGLPILFYSLDKDISEENLMQNPSLYAETRLGKFMNFWTLLYWFIRSILQSAIVFFSTYYLFGTHYIQPSGQPVDFAGMSSLAYGICIFIQTTTILVESNNVTILNHFAIWGTLLLYYVSMLLLNAVAPFLKSVMYRLFADPTFWFALGMTTLLAFFPFLSIKYIYFNFLPMRHQIIQYLESLDEPEFSKLLNSQAGRSDIVSASKKRSSGPDNEFDTLALRVPHKGEQPLLSDTTSDDELVHLSPSGSLRYDLEYGPTALSVMPLKEIRRMQRERNKSKRTSDKRN